MLEKLKPHSKPIRWDILIAKDTLFDLTKGKEYPVVDIHKFGLWVNNDTGNREYYSFNENSYFYWRKRFTLKEAKEEAVRPKYTIKDFYDNIRELLTESRDWWNRLCSQEKNRELLKKYGIDDITDEKIIEMYQAEHGLSQEFAAQLPPTDAGEEAYYSKTDMENAFNAGRETKFPNNVKPTAENEWLRQFVNCFPEWMAKYRSQPPNR